MDTYEAVYYKLDAIGRRYGRIARSTPFKGVNFMTNRIAGRWQTTNETFFELSYGKFMDKWLFGVTFAENNSKENNQACSNYEDVEALLKQVTA